MNIHTRGMMVSPRPARMWLRQGWGRALRHLKVLHEDIDVFLKDVNGPKGRQGQSGGR